MKLDYGTVYKITNLVNNKIYIGQTIHSLKHRFNQHTRKSGCTRLYNAIIKYGKENFKIEELEKVNKEDLDVREIYWINYYNSMDKNIGYNLIPGGKLGPLGKYKLNSDQIEEIIKLDSENISHIEIGKKFNINRKTVTFILRRETDYTSKYKTLKNRTDLEEIKQFIYENNPTALEVRQKFKMSPNTLFKFTKSIGYKFPTYRERQRNQEYNSSKSVQTPPSNVEG